MSNDTNTAPASETPNGAVLTGETPTTSAATSETQEATNTASLSPDELSKELERLKSSLKRANAEAKQYREKATELDTLKKQAEDEKLSETERLQKQLAELTAQREEEAEAIFIQSVTQEAIVQAAKLGVDPNLMESITNFWQRIEIDDDGKATNVGELVKQLSESLALMRKSASAPTSGGATNPPRSQSQAPQALSWEVLGKMTPSEYGARRDEIQRWILSNPPRFR